jgi:hypothetical protein
MHPRRLVRGAALLVALLLTATVLLQTPTARAAANAPRWSQGDYWQFSDRNDQPIRYSVVAKDPVALTGGTYDTWHVTETLTSGSMSFTTDRWLRDTDIGTAKTSVSIGGVTSVETFDPPQSQAEFPLYIGKTWSQQSHTITTTGGFVSTGTLTYSGSVEAEQDLTVPAGTFHVFVIRTPTASGYAKLYYSDSIGFWVKQENYNSRDVLTASQILTSYSYQSATLTNFTIIAIIAIIVVAVIFFLWWKRKQALGRPGGPKTAPMRPASPPYSRPPYSPQSPAYPPQQPPGGPPQTPP